MAYTHDKPKAATAEPVLAGLLAEFAGPEDLLAAAAKMRDRGLRKWDAHSPYPVHGIDRAMGTRMTGLPWLVLAAGVVGVCAALLLQGWTSAVDYKIITSGKPLFALPAFIPITFEMLVLFAAITAFLGTLALNLLPRFWHPVFSSERFRRATADRFFISIDAADKRFDVDQLRKALEHAGAVAVEEIFDWRQPAPYPSLLFWTLGVGVTVAIIPPLLVAAYRYSPKTEPRIHIIQDMDFQPRYAPQGISLLFADGRAMRPQVEGTETADPAELDDHFARGIVNGAPATTFPMPASEAMVRRGQERFAIYCAPCHGLVGEGGGTGMVAARAIRRTDNEGYVPPVSMLVDDIRRQPVGQLFQTITNGVRTMPAYGPQIPPADRWAIVLYIRALQLSQNAPLDDVPPERRDSLR